MSATPWNRVTVAKDGDRLALERRGDRRRAVSGRVTAVTNHGIDMGPMNRIMPLQLLNMSDSGVGAIAQDETAVGSLITIFFPPHGPERGFDAKGRVVRCRPFEHGYEVGIRLEGKAAA